MKHKMRAYTTTTGHLLNRFFQKIKRTTHQDPHPALIIASHHFDEPYPLVNETDLLSLAIMDLLIQFAYPFLSGYAKFTISYTMMQSYGEEISSTNGGDEVSFTIGPAIPLTDQDCKLIPKSEVYAHIYQAIKKLVEKYEGEVIVRLMIRVYMDGKKMDRPAISEDERYSTLSSIIQAGLTEKESIRAREIRNRNRSHPSHITALKASRTELKAFMVADTETLLIDNVHKPYALGLLMVRPGEEINDLMIDTYFSEDYSRILESFEERSTKVLYDFVLRPLRTIVRQEKSCLTIYFHNFSRFDGLRHLASHHKNYKLKPLMRNHKLYELAVYSGKKMLFRFRDSLNLLPGKLSNLAKSLCPELGTKGSIEYDKVEISNHISMKKHLVDYMKQDILLLAGVMKKAQEIYWKLYKIDIESKITLSSMALSIFRMKYYDEISKYTSQTRMKTLF